MANGEEKGKGKDFYEVLGLEKACTASELRNAYKKLAMRWHPDRCSASGNNKSVEESKKKFQAIQQAYSVLSDGNKRFLYDVGAYDSDDDDNAMGDFLNEMAVMMSQTKPHQNGEETFEDLQQLFEELFQGDLDSSGVSCHATRSCSISSSVACSESTSSCNKRLSSEMNSGKAKVEASFGFDSHFHQFCLGVEQQQDFTKGKGVSKGTQGGADGRRRQGRKQKVSPGHDVSSNDYGISAS